MITSAQQLVFSVSAVRRILGVSSELEIKVRVWAKVLWIHVAGRRPTFVSKQALLLHFVEWRKATSRSLQVTQFIARNDLFTVRNKGKRSVYKVQIYTGGVRCECEDFKNQSLFLGRACCKHCYAVLGHLGFGSLADYIEGNTASLAA
jgi:translation elongation factor EF-Ts